MLVHILDAENLASRRAADALVDRLRFAKWGCAAKDSMHLLVIPYASFPTDGRLAAADGKPQGLDDRGVTARLDRVWAAVTKASECCAILVTRYADVGYMGEYLSRYRYKPPPKKPEPGTSLKLALTSECLGRIKNTHNVDDVDADGWAGEGKVKSSSFDAMIMRLILTGCELCVPLAEKDAILGNFPLLKLLFGESSRARKQIQFV